MSLPPGVPVLPPGQALVDLRNTYGAVYIGSTISIGLLGATTMQVWFYYNRFPEDPLWMKFMVFGVWVVEFLRSTFTAQAVYYYLVINWGNVVGLNVIHWSLGSIVITTNIGELYGHLYFVWRIYMLSRGTLRYILVPLVTTVVLWNFGMGTATYVSLTRATSPSSFSGGVLAPIALSTAIASDVLIAGSLVLLLSQGRTGFSRTNRLINTLIFYSIQIGLVTVVADIVTLVLSQFTSKTGFDYIGVYTIIGNLYANSLLASMNARSALKDVGGSIVTSTGQASSLPMAFDTRNNFRTNQSFQTSSNTHPTNMSYQARSVHLSDLEARTSHGNNSEVKLPSAGYSDTKISSTGGAISA